MVDNQLTVMFRGVVSSLRNVPNEETNDVSSCSSSRPEHCSIEHELVERFRIPRESSNSAWPLPRSGRRRFVPYTTAAKGKKGKLKEKSSVELVIKNVCLLPSPDWHQVP